MMYRYSIFEQVMLTMAYTFVKCPAKALRSGQQVCRLYSKLLLVLELFWKTSTHNTCSGDYVEDIGNENSNCSNLLDLTH